MLTIKSVVRKINANQKRIQKQRLRNQKLKAQWNAQKAQEEQIQENINRAEYFNQYIEMIKSLHKESSEVIDWDEVRDSIDPPIPAKETTNVDKVQKELENIKLNLFEKVFSNKDKKKAVLERKLEEAEKLDDKIFEEVLKVYREELKVWETVKGFAEKLYKKDFEVYKDIYLYFEFLSDIELIGNGINMRVSEDGKIMVDVFINDEEIIPKNEISVTKTGKLSSKNMAKGKFNELYQDHVVSVLIRIALEFFAHYPIEEFIVNAQANLLDSTTGTLKEQTIVSVLFTRE